MSLEKILPATCNYGNSTAYCNKWMPYIGLNRWGVCVFEDGVHLAEGAQGLFDHQQYSQLLFPVEKGRPSLWLARAPQSLSLSLPFSHILLPASPQSIPTSKGQEEVATFFEVVCTALGLQS